MKILSQSPCRISLFGGGTDIEPYCSLYGGMVINMAINLRQKITLYSGDNLYNLGGPNQFVANSNPEFYYSLLNEFGINDRHLSKFKCEFDGLIESGIGSSAAAAVCMIGAINKRKDLRMSLSDIAEKAWDIEVNKLGLFGGKQDQYCSAYGGVNVMFFEKQVRVHQMDQEFIRPFISSFVLFYSGQNRKSVTIQEAFKDLKIGQIEALNKIKELANKALDYIDISDVEGLGRLLDKAWEFKKLSNPGVNSPSVDKIYQAGKKHGALGGKVMGAGGGGYFVFMVYPEKREKFIESMTHDGFDWWDFSICWNGLEVRDITNQ